MGSRIAKARQMKNEIIPEIDANNRISERDKIIIRRVLDGETYKAVGKDFDICLERVRGVCFCAFRQKLGLNI